MTTEVAIDTVRLDGETRNHLMTLKRRTGIDNWNVLARWAFCVSLQDDAPLRQREDKGLGAIEMTWRTFGGEAEEVYMALLRARCDADGNIATRDTLAELLRGHIARGAARLVGNRQMKSISDLATTLRG
jgi:DNA sulfur modification protein DndE